MPFFTERLTCKACGGTFIVGGERVEAPGEYQYFKVECPRCHATVDTTWEGEVRLPTLQVKAD